MSGSELVPLSGDQAPTVTAPAPSAPNSSGAAPVVREQSVTPYQQTQDIPQPGDLTDMQVSAAIDRGMRGKRHNVGLTLNDIQTALLSGMACATCGTSGYTIIAFTPEQWVEHIAMEAKTEMKPFSIADVNPDLRRPVLRVLALPSSANYITGAGLSMASSVHRVVLNNTKHSEIIQPIQNENGQTESNSAYRSVTYQTASATFLMSDVEHIRSEDKDGEFFIVVVGDRQNKFFKVKSRYLKDLFGKGN